MTDYYIDEDECYLYGCTDTRKRARLVCEHHFEEIYGADYAEIHTFPEWGKRKRQIVQRLQDSYPEEGFKIGRVKIRG